MKRTDMRKLALLTLTLVMVAPAHAAQAQRHSQREIAQILSHAHETWPLSVRQDDWNEIKRGHYVKHGDVIYIPGRGVFDEDCDLLSSTCDEGHRLTGSGG